MLINENNLPLVAMDFMNKTHVEDAQIINRLYDATQAYEKEPNQDNFEQINTIYTEWFEHTIAHFKAEESMMLERSFPPYPMHKGEHDRALHLMDEIFRKWSATKEVKVLQEYFSESLLPWLLHHIQTMDTVTASFFKTGLSPCSAH